MQLLGLTLLDDPDAISTVAPGSPQDAPNSLTPTLSIPGLISVGLLTQTSHSRVTTSAESTATSQVAGVSLLNGAIRADVIRAQSHSTASVGNATHDSIGSNFANLVVNGVALSNVPPNTSINVKIGLLTVAKVVLYEDTGSVTKSGGFTTVTDSVNMIDVTLLSPLGRPGGRGAHHRRPRRTPTPSTRPRTPACGVLHRGRER